MLFLPNVVSRCTVFSSLGPHLLRHFGMSQDYHCLWKQLKSVFTLWLFPSPSDNTCSGQCYHSEATLRKEVEILRALGYGEIVTLNWRGRLQCVLQCTLSRFHGICLSGYRRSHRPQFCLLSDSHLHVRSVGDSASLCCSQVCVEWIGSCRRMGMPLIHVGFLKSQGPWGRELWTFSKFWVFYKGFWKHVALWLLFVVMMPWDFMLSKVTYERHPSVWLQ